MTVIDDRSTTRREFLNKFWGPIATTSILTASMADTILDTVSGTTRTTATTQTMTEYSGRDGALRRSAPERLAETLRDGSADDVEREFAAARCTDHGRW